MHKPWGISNIRVPWEYSWRFNLILSPREVSHLLTWWILPGLPEGLLSNASPNKARAEGTQARSCKQWGFEAASKNHVVQKSLRSHKKRYHDLILHWNRKSSTSGREKNHSSIIMIELVVIVGRNADNLKYEKVNLLSSKCPLLYFKYFSDCSEKLLF